MSKEKRRSRVHLEEHEEHVVHDESNWLVSYADMMTLLFGFFVLMYSMSRFDNTKFDLVRKEIAQYFGGNVKMDGSLMVVEQKLVNILKGSGELSGVEISKGPSDLQLLLKFDGEFLFESGAVELKEAAKPLLRKAVAGLRSVSEIEKINIEGHTDNDAINNPIIKSNWELSSLRAGSVVRYFEESGVKPEILSAVGYGSSRPLVPNEDPQGQSLPKNKAQNRRVVVSVHLLDPEAAYRLQQKQFTKKLSKEEIEQQKKEVELQDKLKQAQLKFEETQKRLKIQQDQKRKEEQLRKIERQIQNLEGKVKQYENDLKQ